LLRALSAQPLLHKATKPLCSLGQALWPRAASQRRCADFSVFPIARADRQSRLAQERPDMTTVLGGHDRCIDHACWLGWRKKPNIDLPIVVAARLPALLDLGFGARNASDACALLRYA
jgi:hypothetical protein